MILLKTFLDGSLSQAPCFFMDSLGLPHCAWISGTTLNYAWHNGLDWWFPGDQSLVLECPGVVIDRHCLAVDDGGLPYLSITYPAVTSSSSQSWSSVSSQSSQSNSSSSSSQSGSSNSSSSSLKSSSSSSSSDSSGSSNLSPGDIVLYCTMWNGTNWVAVAGGYVTTGMIHSQAMAYQGAPYVFWLEGGRPDTVSLKVATIVGGVLQPVATYADILPHTNHDYALLARTVGSQIYLFWKGSLAGQSWIDCVIFDTESSTFYADGAPKKIVSSVVTGAITGFDFFPLPLSSLLSSSSSSSSSDSSGDVHSGGLLSWTAVIDGAAAVHACWLRATSTEGVLREVNVVPYSSTKISQDAAGLTESLTGNFVSPLYGSPTGYLNQVGDPVIICSGERIMQFAYGDSQFVLSCPTPDIPQVPVLVAGAAFKDVLANYCAYLSDGSVVAWIGQSEDAISSSGI